MKSHVLFYLLLVIILSSGLRLHAQTAISQDYLKSFNSQLYFEVNLGQYNDSIRFQTYMHNRQIRFLESGPSYAEVRELDRDPSPNNPFQRKFENYSWLGEREAEHEALVWNTNFLNTSGDMQVTGKKALPGKFHYFQKANLDEAATEVIRYQELWYTDIYPDMDLRYYGTAEQALKYDFILSPGADITNIDLQFSGITGFDIDSEGKLVIHTAWGDVVDAAPYSYQYGYEGEIPVEVQYKKLADDRLGFEIVGNNYDPNKTLVLDPLTMSWATYFHSSSSDDYVMAVDVDADENIYITGYTKSQTFPVTPGTYENVYGGGIDCYVAKIIAGGTAPVYATYIGGSDWEMAYGLRINAAGEVFISGFGASTDFPITVGAVQPVNEGGGVEGFVVRLNEDGNALVYSTYLGGTDRDYVYDLEVNAANEAYVTGYTYSSDFPTTAGAYSTTYAGNGDVFVSRLSADGTGMVFSTFYGGLNYDIGNTLSLGSANEVYIAGNTASLNLPLSAANIQDTLNFAAGLTVEDAFVLQLSADGSNLEYATYLGGTDSDGAYGMDISPAGEVYITGTTYSRDFPTSISAMQDGSSPNLGSGDVFVAKLDVPNNELDYSTYVAGSDIDFVKSLVINSYGEAHILGATRSANWPVTPNSNGISAQYDLFVTILNADGSSLLDSELFGGSYNDYPRASGSMRYINDRVIVAATTHSADIPLTGVTYQTTKTNGLADSPWIGSISIDITLPVELNAFDATWNQVQQAVNMEWLVFEGEIGEGGNYIVERREKGKSWEEIFYQGIQESEEWVNLYTYQDQEARLFPGKELAYRIKYQGLDGSVNYSLSQSLSIPLDEFVHVSLYPNPIQDVLSLDMTFQKPQDQVNMVLYDFVGRIVWTENMKVPEGNIKLEKQINLSALKPGIYHLALWDGEGHEVTQAVVKN